MRKAVVHWTRAEKIAQVLKTKHVPLSHFSQPVITCEDLLQTACSMLLLKILTISRIHTRPIA